MKLIHPMKSLPIQSAQFFAYLSSANQSFVNNIINKTVNREQRVQRERSQRSLKVFLSKNFNHRWWNRWIIEDCVITGLEEIFSLWEPLRGWRQSEFQYLLQILIEIFRKWMRDDLNTNEYSPLHSFSSPFRSVQFLSHFQQSIF